MKFEIDRDELLKPLQAVIGVVERRQTLPVLANMLVVASSTGVSFTATDLEVELVAQAVAEVSEEGECTLPARKLMDIVRNLPAQTRVQIDLQKNRAVVTAARSRFSLAVLPPSDFPTVDQIGASEALSIPQHQLKRLIEKTHFAMALQDVRYYLNGLLLEVEPKYLRAVATDGHRLAFAEAIADVDIANPRQVIVPRKGIQELSRLLEQSDDLAHLEIGNNHIRVTLPDIRFTSKLIDGRFPDYQRVIPQNANKIMETDRDSLKQALVRASILSNEKYRGVRLVLDKDSLRIQSNNPEQEEAEEELLVNYHDQPMEIGFNASYMLDALNAIEEDSVQVVLLDSNSSALMRGTGNDDSKYVIMPMRL